MATVYQDLEHAVRTRLPCSFTSDAGHGCRHTQNPGPATGCSPVKVQAVLGHEPPGRPLAVDLHSLLGQLVCAGLLEHRQIGQQAVQLRRVLLAGQHRGPVSLRTLLAEQVSHRAASLLELSGCGCNAGLGPPAWRLKLAAVSADASMLLPCICTCLLDRLLSMEHCDETGVQSSWMRSPSAVQVYAWAEADALHSRQIMLWHISW